MKRLTIPSIIILLLVSACVLKGETAANDRDLFNRAKLLLFDRNYGMALNVLNQLMTDFPKSPYYSQALFYKSKCLEENKMAKEALKSYYSFLKISKNESLSEEATISIIDLNFLLYKKGEKKHLESIKKFLKHNQRAIKYYAAIKLSYAPKENTANAAVPVLKHVISTETDEELIDRAKLALMRISPRHIKELSKAKSIYSRNLYLQTYNKKTKTITFSFNIPFALAKLALDALPDDEKELLKKEEHDLDKILKLMVETGEIFKLESEESIFKIWVE
jgi:hypothetical protein